MKKFPIGIQNIWEILEEGYVYVDKTQYAKELIKNGKHYFLSRPRRFGKSLFLNTLREIFKGNKELFKESSIYKSDYQWDTHPVVYIDFSKIANSTPLIFQESLKRYLESLANQHKVSISGKNIQEGLEELVVSLSKSNRVVVLVDEYDKPIIDSLENLEVCKGNREVLKIFFTILKSLDEYLKFTFTTGVIKFSQTSLFSGPNNLKDISMDPRYAGLMGYTEEEIKENFSLHLQTICDYREERKRPITDSQLLEEMRFWYNGYQFSRDPICVYNPFSTLNFLDEKETSNYWYRSGTPSFLIKQVKKYPKSLVPLRGVKVLGSHLSDISNLDRIRLPTLMFQSGYLTIRDYDFEKRAYTLDFPNEEVRSSFFDTLLDEFSEIDPLKVLEEASNLRSSLESLDLQSFFSIMKGHFASIPYYLFPKGPLSQENRAWEGFYHAIFFILMEKSSLQCFSEVPTNQGRIDLVCELDQMLCLFEFKLEVSADAALLQVQEKKNLEKYLNKGKQILILGVNFTISSRNIESWSALLFTASGDLLEKMD